MVTAMYVSEYVEDDDEDLARDADDPRSQRGPSGEAQAG